MVKQLNVNVIAALLNIQHLVRFAAHTRHALRTGETPQRLNALVDWKDSDLFDDIEKAVLAYTDEATLIFDKGVSAATYRKLSQYFDEHLIAQIITRAVLINSWNRIAISTRLKPQN